MSMNRRTFLHLGGGAVAATVFGSAVLPGSAQAHQTGSATEPTRTLLVVDLQGGNDALNTLVPDSGIYRDFRPTLAVPEGDLLSFAGLDQGVHPALASLERFWDAGQLAAVYGTGMEGQGRSHFVAQDAWRTARPGEPARSGWLGRWLEAEPVADSPLRAIALGQSTLAAQGDDGRPVAIQSVSGFQLNPPAGNADVTAAVLAMGQGEGTGLFGRAQAAIPQAVDAVTQLQSLVAGVEVGDDTDIDLDGDRSLFSAAQAIIQGDVGTQILYLTVNGFDTHSLQAPKQDQLLRLVSDGLADLFGALETTGHADSTTALVVSEFGRRAAENGSAGTDHGRGGLSFLIGPSVKESMLVGEPDLGDLIEGDLRITTDARHLYDNSLRWLGASDDTIVEVLGGEWTDLSLLA